MTQTIESIIEENQSLVVSLARKVHRTLPPQIPFEDVLGYGQLGLAQAARSYVPVEGAEFQTYAYYRISGAIYDGLARMSWMSRAEFRRVRAARAAQEFFEEQNREKAPAEADGLASDFSDRVEALATIYHFSALSETGETEVPAGECGPDRQAEKSELHSLLRAALETLDTAERELIELTYFDDLSLAEAAGKMGRSRSWGSRVHSRVLKKLGAKLAGRKS